MIDRDDEPSGTPGTPQPPTLDHMRPPSPEGEGGSEQDDFLIQPPTVSLPKGGGAIQSIGEKFQANPVTGTGSLSVPVALSPGRQGFGPSLALSYDSGAGNGPFGHGWNVGISSVRRKTDKGLPRYHDAAAAGQPDSDVFVLAGAEDLVPMRDDQGNLEPTRPEGEYTVQRYRPRVEGGFSRIERWRKADGDVHWRTRSPDNVLRIYGQDPTARVADPDNPSRVFEWLLEEVQDEVGNLVRYTYKAEDRDGITASPAEFNRTQPGNQCTYVYPKEIRYGNRVANPTVDGDWAFQVVFDYGEHTASVPTPTEDQDWPARADPYSSFRAGFDVRCYRLCRRILMFHRFSALSSGAAVLVRSTEMAYDEKPHLTKLTSVTHRGWRLDTTTSQVTSLALPAVQFTYLEAEIGETVQFVQGLDDIPGRFDTGSWQWIDLDGEGLTGLLTERAGAWYYKRNEGQGTLGAVQRLGQRPSLGLGGAQLLDLGGTASSIW